MLCSDIMMLCDVMPLFLQKWMLYGLDKCLCGGWGIVSQAVPREYKLFSNCQPITAGDPQDQYLTHCFSVSL